MRPLLKWAGGKRQLLPVLRQHYPSSFERYVEPFLGSGAVFFDLHGSGALEGRAALLADANPDLIGCYLMVRDRVEAVLAELAELDEGHARGREAFYYEVRNERFNAQRRDHPDYTPELAAMFLYLNRTGFNGLFRLNRRGEFNVPVGRYVNPRICDPVHLRAASAALRTAGVTIELRPFAESLAGATVGDFVYCDPPYAPLTKTACFASYTAGGFNWFDQRALQQSVLGAMRRGAWVVLSNSCTPEIEALYGSSEVRAAGLEVQRVPARRSINSRAHLRGAVHEIIVTPLLHDRRLADIVPRMLRARSAPPVSGSARAATARRRA
ncbi:MAG: Dam family site-specific DNA-(adenine-N6)-methyltransferase [Vicinamibacterales bacterium]